MADPIIIQVKLAPDEITRSAQAVGKAVKTTIEKMVPDMETIGVKMGKALAAGIATGLRSAANLKRQLDNVLSPDQRHSTTEQKERAHSRRIEAIQTQSASRLAQIEARKQAQIDVIRERAAQRETEHQRRIERATQASTAGVSGFSSAVKGTVGVFGAFAAIGAVRLFENIASRAVAAAISIDRQVSSLRALTGSAEAAQRRFQELFRIAQQTPGLTTNLAATLDAQLRVFRVNEQTINRLLPVIGRLNAIAPLSDPNQFVRNVVQLASQNFEVQDLRELVGQSPIAGQLIQQIFNVDSPINGRAIRQAAQRLGVTSVERLAEELIKAAETNSALKNAVETIGGQFDKLGDRLNVALAPLGNEIAKTLIPIFDDLVKTVERYGNSAARIFAENRNDIIAAAREVGVLAVEIGKLIAPLASSPRIREFFQNFAVEAARVRDVLDSSSLSERAKRLFGVEKGPAQLEAERQIRENEARAAFPRGFQPNMTIDFAEESRLAAEAFARFQEQQRAARNRSAATRAGVSSRARQAQDLFSNVQRRDEPTIAELNRAIDQNMDRVFRAAVEVNEAERKAQLEQGRLARQALTRDFEEREEAIKKQREALEKLQPVLSNGERFMKGFAAAVETTGDAFERLGANIASSFRDVGNLLDNLKQSVLSFFNDLLGQSLQRVIGQVLAPIAVAFGGGGGFALPGGGSLFRTPPTFPSSISASAIQNLVAAAGGGLSAPPSITQTQQLQQIFSEIAGPATRPRTVT